MEADYSRLLSEGTTFDSSDGTQPDEWRKAIRERARADRLKVRTGMSDSRTERTGRRVAWAYLTKRAEDAQAAYAAYDDAERADDPDAVRAATDRLHLLGLDTPRESVEKVDRLMRDLLGDS